MISPATVQTLKSLLFNEQSATAFAILDGASVSDLPAYLASFNPQHICLHRGELEPDMAEVAPYLAILEHDAPFTDWVFSNGWGNHWGIFGIAQAGLPVLRNHFRSFLRVPDESGRSLYFRYYDPRVWRDYLPEGNSDELKTVFGPVISYFVEGETPRIAKRFTFVDQALNEDQFEVDPFQRLLSRQLHATASPAEPALKGREGFIRISAERLATLTRMSFYSRLFHFVTGCCKNPSLLAWVTDAERKRSLWDSVWPDVRQLSEHDCALALIYLAVCDCEGIVLDAQRTLLRDLRDKEIEMKRFLSDRGYFRFSDFDYREG